MLNISNKMFYGLLIVIAFICLILGTLNSSVFAPLYALGVIIGAMGVGREIIIEKMNKQIDAQYKGVL